MKDGKQKSEGGGRKAEALVRRNAQSIRFDPTRSDSIRPGPTEFDRMKPIVDCNCTMAGAARWIATSGRDGRRQEKDVRLKSSTLDSSIVLSLLNGYRARRSRSTSLLDCIGRFTERRMAELDERFRLLTSAATNRQRIAQQAHLLTSVATGVGAIPGRQSFGLVLQNEAKCRLWSNPKDISFPGNAKISICFGSGDETCFYETNPYARVRFRPWTREEGRSDDRCVRAQIGFWTVGSNGLGSPFYFMAREIVERTSKSVFPIRPKTEDAPCAPPAFLLATPRAVGLRSRSIRRSRRMGTDESEPSARRRSD